MNDMKGYIRITVEQLRDGVYVADLLRNGHVLIQAVVDTENEEIVEVTSYTNDKQCESYYHSLAGTEEQLRKGVIMETLYPCYAFKNEELSSSLCCCAIDIESDCQDIISFAEMERRVKSMKATGGDNTYYEYYVSKAKGDIKNFGGPLELDFVELLMTEKGYYNSKE